MKKYLIFFLFLICGTLIFSCTDNEIDSGDDLNSGNEIIIPDEISPVIDYRGLGFILPFLVADVPNGFQFRTDGEIDPLRNSSYLSQPQPNLSNLTRTLKEKFFNSDDYALYGYSEGPVNFFYYPDICYVNGKLKVLFFDNQIDYTYTYIHQFLIAPFIDGVVSNNQASYVINTNYFGTSSHIQHEYYFIFSALYYDDTFPYRVYFNSEYIFLMSKNDDFSKRYLEKFTPENGVYLFKN